MKTVSVLGVLHNLHTTRFADTYSLDDLAAILRALRPDCVLAELPPGWDERRTAETLPDFKMEYREVILPLAKEIDYTVIPVDYASPRYAEAGAHWDEARQTLVPYGAVKHALLTQFEEAVFEALSQGFQSPAALNSAACNDLIWAVKEVETRWFFQEHSEHDIWEQHNQLNYEKMLEAIRQREEARFLITFGLYHKYWFEARLQHERWLHFEPIAEQLNKLYGQRGREHSE